jgi:hypothetical protein
MLALTIKPDDTAGIGLAQGAFRVFHELADESFADNLIEVLAEELEPNPGG